MFYMHNQNRFIYILSNLIVLPAVVVPEIDFISNLSFIVSLILLGKTNLFLSTLVCLITIMKNNANYRFNLLLKIKGNELSKSDYECVYLYAWCTLLRYSLIGIVVNQIFISFK